MAGNRFNFRLATGGFAAAALGLILLLVGGMEEVDLPYWPYNAIAVIMLGIMLFLLSLRDILRKD